MFCNTCVKNPCQCAKTGDSSAPWLFQRCKAEGCTVTIRVRAGHQSPYPLCKWCQEKPKEVSA